MTTLVAAAKELWVELTNGHEFPTEAVKRNLLIMDDAVYMANRLKKMNPDHNRQVLLATAALLDVDLSK
jgi:hypothetical protein